GRNDRLRADHRWREGRRVTDVARDELDPVGQPTQCRPAGRHVPGQDPHPPAPADETSHDIPTEQAGPAGDEDHRTAPAEAAAIAGPWPTLPRIDEPTSTAVSSSGS